MDEQDVKIAVLEKEVQGLREQHREHKIEITKSLDNFKEVVSESIQGIRDDIKEIYQFINTSKGYYAAVLLASSVIGGAVVAIASKIMDHIWK